MHIKGKNLDNVFKKAAVFILTAAMLAALTCGCTLNKPQDVVLATTTSVNDSGLLDYLSPQLQKDTGINLKIIAQGTGQAIKTGESGDADVLLVHDRKSEDKFIESGNGLKRIELMYNFYVIAGPQNDPAGIKGLKEKNASDAFKKIAAAQSNFVSRGDDSGTNKKELSIWKAIGIEPSGSWYISAGKGMGAVLSMSDEKNAYTLTDKATYLSMKDKLSLQILLENSKDLKNQYTIMQVNPELHKAINSKGAAKFIKWITSDKALKMINNYGKDKYGENLFNVNYVPD